MADKTHVLTGEVMVLWDGITKPSESDDGSLTHNLRVAIHPDAPQLAELRALYEETLRSSEFKGVLPKGGNEPFMDADPSKFGAELDGYVCFTAGTRRGIPPVVDKNNAELPPMKFPRSFYAGAMVELYVHAYAYNNKQKGIAFGLNGIKVLDTTTPALAIGGGVSPQEVLAAFGASPTKGVPAPGGFTMTGLATSTRAEYHAAGWTDDMLISEGLMIAPKKATPPAPKPKSPPPPPAKKPAAPPPPKAATKPHPGILAGAPVHVMTADATDTYEGYIEAGWTDDLLIEHGLMEAPKPKSPPPPPAKKPAAPPPPKAKAGPTMTEHAESSYDEYIGAGWDDAMLIAAGFMEA